MKKLLSVVLSILITLLGTFGISAYTEDNGISQFTWGNHTYSLNDCVLTISGNGYITYGSGDGNEPAMDPQRTEMLSKATHLVIESGITGIDTIIFREYATNIESAEIADSVIKISGDAFYNTTLYKNKNNWKDGVLYISNHLIASMGVVGEYTVKDGTVTIADEAFLNSGITKIVIPDSVSSIGNNAFRGCKSLDDIVVSGDVKYIGADAFYNTLYLNNDENFEDGLLYIGTYLVKANDVTDDEYVIKEGTRVIGEGAFAECGAVKKIFIPSSVIAIRQNAFKNASGREVHINDLADWCKIDFECNPLSSQYSADLNANYLFVNGEKVADLIIPDGVTAIPDNAFEHCLYSFKSVVIPDSVKSIGKLAFIWCYSVKSVTIGDGVESIGEWAFRGCSGLEKVVIGDGLTKIGTEFSATAIKEIVIGDNVTEIAHDAFEYCNYLTNITVPKSLTSLAAFSECGEIKDVWYRGSADDRLNISSIPTNMRLATWHYNICNTDEHLYTNDTDESCENCEWVRQITQSGDINNDKNINNKDLGLLMQYLNDWDVEISEQAADVNNDKNINNKDYGLLMQYLNDWDVELQ